MKVHVGVDKDSVLIHSVAVTPANVHDLTTADGLLRGVPRRRLPGNRQKARDGSRESGIQSGDAAW